MLENGNYITIDEAVRLTGAKREALEKMREDWQRLYMGAYIAEDEQHRRDQSGHNNVLQDFGARARFVPPAVYFRGGRAEIVDCVHCYYPLAECFIHPGDIGIWDVRVHTPPIEDLLPRYSQLATALYSVLPLNVGLKLTVTVRRQELCTFTELQSEQ